MDSALERRKEPPLEARVKTKPMRKLSLAETAAEWEAEWLAKRELPTTP